MIRPALRRAAFVVLVSFVAGTLPARADVQPTQGAIGLAKHHFQQAIALYNDGNFSGALAEFQAAYQTKPAPSILYNIGLTYKSLFLYGDAIRTLEQYLKEDTTLTTERRAEATQLVGEMRALLADLTLTITPDGSDVRIDNRLVGQSPLGTYLVAAGRHVLDISHDGYVGRSKEIMVTAGVPVALTLELAVVPKTGRVRLAVQPGSAAVRVDGRLVQAPLELELPLGGHTLEASARGYQTHREEVLIAPGQTRDISLRLARPPIYKRAALWVPLAIGIVVVAGLGVGLGLGLTRDDRLSGTLPPYRAGVGQ